MSKRRERPPSIPRTHAIARGIKSALAGYIHHEGFPFGAMLLGACTVASSALVAAYRVEGIPARFLTGSMRRPKVIDPHTWVEVDGFHIDLTSPIRDGTFDSWDEPRIFLSPKGAYVVRGTLSDMRPEGALAEGGAIAEAVDNPSSPWACECFIVGAVMAVTKRPMSEVARHVTELLWGSDERRVELATPAVLRSSLRLHIGALPTEDVQAFTCILGRTGNLDGWVGLRESLLRDVRLASALRNTKSGAPRALPERT